MNSLSATMRNGEEGVSYRLVFLNGSTAAKSVNFVNGEASDSSVFSTEGNYTIALVAGNVVLQQYANIRVGNPPAQTYEITSSIRNNPGSSVITMTVDGNVVASGSQVEEGKTVHVEITNATENWEAFTVNNVTKTTTLSGTSRVVDFTMPSANASCVASFTTPPTPGEPPTITGVTVDGQPLAQDGSATGFDPDLSSMEVTFSGSGSGYKFAMKNPSGTLYAKQACGTSPHEMTWSSFTPATGVPYNLVLIDSEDNIMQTWGTITA